MASRSYRVYSHGGFKHLTSLSFPCAVINSFIVTLKLVCYNLHGFKRTTNKDTYFLLLLCNKKKLIQTGDQNCATGMILYLRSPSFLREERPS